MPYSTKRRRVELRRSELAKLYKQGITNQSRLAEKLGVARITINKDLKALNERWKEMAVVDLDAAKGKLLSELNDLKYTYWKSWQMSLVESKIKTLRAKANEAGTPQPTEQTIKTEDSYGDPRYLQGVERCITEQCKILGLYAPIKHAVASLQVTLALPADITEDQL